MLRRSRFAAVFGILVISVSAHAQSAQSLTLADAIKMAVANSPIVDQALAAADATRARVGTVASATLPQLEADASYTRIDPTVTVTFPINGTPTEFSFSPNNVYNGSLTLQQSILDFGKSSSQLMLAESAVTSATDRAEQAKELVAYQTIQSYYAILALEQNIAIEQDQVDVLKQALEVAETRERAGTATTLDPLNTQVRISGLQNQLSTLRAARTKQVSVLRRLTGSLVEKSVTVIAPTERATIGSDVDSLTSVANLQRLEVKTAIDEEHTAALAIDAAKANDNPNLGLNVTGGVKDGYPPELEKPVLNWAGSVGLRVPILDGGRTKSMVEEAQANYRAAQARTAEAKLAVRTDVEQSLADVQSVEEQRQLITSQLQQAREALEITQLRYKNGAATNLDVLTAQSNLEEVQLQQAQLSYQYALSEYTLERAVGNRLY